jgi:RNA polymerase-binding transcription factor
MDDIRHLLDENLTAALLRLRHLGGAVAVEDLPGAIRDNSRLANKADDIQANENREISFATREKLMERANRLSAALDRLNAGEYGVCEECAEQISPARLQAVPEVQTCVRCQDRIERFARQV